MMQVLALAVVSVGVAVVTVTNLDFNLFGALIAIAWKIPSAINKQKRRRSSKHNLKQNH